MDPRKEVRIYQAGDDTVGSSSPLPAKPVMNLILGHWMFFFQHDSAVRKQAWRARLSSSPLLCTNLYTTLLHHQDYQGKLKAGFRLKRGPQGCAAQGSGFICWDPIPTPPPPASYHTSEKASVIWPLWLVPFSTVYNKPWKDGGLPLFKLNGQMNI
jgi:hypothetical protein